MSMPEVFADKVGWTQFKPVICECTATKIGMTNTSAGKKPSIILELTELEFGLEIIKFLNVNETKSGSFSVKRNSDFARLFRLTIGQEPGPKKSRVQHLMHNFVGCQFNVHYIQDVDRNGRSYFKAKRIEPVNPIVLPGWFSDGKVRPKASVAPCISALDESLQTNCNQSATTAKKACKKSAMPPLAEPSEQLGLKYEFDFIQDTASKVKSLPHADIYSLDDRNAGVDGQQNRSQQKNGGCKRMKD